MRECTSVNTGETKSCQRGFGLRSAVNPSKRALKKSTGIQGKLEEIFSGLFWIDGVGEMVRLGPRCRSAFPRMKLFRSRSNSKTYENNLYRFVLQFGGDSKHGGGCHFDGGL